MLDGAERELSEARAALDCEAAAFKAAERAGQETLGAAIKQVHEVLDHIISHKGRMKELSDAFAASAAEERNRVLALHANNAAALREAPAARP